MFSEWKYMGEGEEGQSKYEELGIHPVKCCGECQFFSNDMDLPLIGFCQLHELMVTCSGICDQFKRGVFEIGPL
jgi:hypothetical protein